MINLHAIVNRIATELDPEDNEFPWLKLNGPFLEKKKSRYDLNDFTISRELNLDESLKQQLNITGENPVEVSFGIEVDFDIDTSEYGPFRTIETIAIINNYEPITIENFSLTKEDSKIVRNIIGDLNKYEESRISEERLK